MKVDYPYEIVKFRRINTKYGVIVVARLKYNGPFYIYDNHPKSVFLPKRLTKVLTEETIDSYRHFWPLSVDAASTSARFFIWRPNRDPICLKIKKNRRNIQTETALNGISRITEEIVF